MRYAIVESGGKQYRAVEGQTIEVDRLPEDAGKKFDFERILLVADGDEVMVGTPTLGDILVKVTVVDHIKGPKIDRFRYRPKKRIRVRGGHRQQYTRLMVDFIGRPEEEGKRERPAESEVVAKQDVEPEVVVEAEPQAEKKAKAEKAPAKSTTTKKSTTGKSASKKTDSKKK